MRSVAAFRGVEFGGIRFAYQSVFATTRIVLKNWGEIPFESPGT